MGPGVESAGQEGDLSQDSFFSPFAFPEPPTAVIWLLQALMVPQVPSKGQLAMAITQYSPAGVLDFLLQTPTEAAHLQFPCTIVEASSREGQGVWNSSETDVQQPNCFSTLCCFFSFSQFNCKPSWVQVPYPSLEGL